MPDLSIIIPSRQEKYMGRTILNILENTNKDTEIVAVLDGWIPEPDNKPIDNRVRYIENSQPLGQRQSINKAARTCDSRWFTKMDAHIAIDKDFDLKLMANYESDWIVVPRMYNLDVITWQPKWHKRTDYMYISAPWAEKPWRSTYYEGKAKDDYRHQPKSNKTIDDTMTMMGPCYFMSFERFWELGGEDENHGGWGQQGAEWAMKSWTSGGALKVNKNVWFAHFFRGGGVPEGEKSGFPYKLTNGDVEKARTYSQDLWLNDKWPLAKRKLADVIKQFNPPGWNREIVIPKDDSAKKWEKYISSLMERSNANLICIGSNSEYFAFKGKELGYNSKAIENYTEDCIIPIFSTIILTDIHYKMNESDLVKFITRLKAVAKKIIITGDSKQEPEYKIPADLETLKVYFQDWRKRQVIKGSSRYSILYMNPVVG